jgi:hypothetical protein
VPEAIQLLLQLLGLLYGGHQAAALFLQLAQLLSLQE